MILIVAALVGLVTVPVWVSKAAGPRDVVLTSNVQTVAAVYGSAVADPSSPSCLRTPNPETGRVFAALFRRPVVNPVTHSSRIVGGNEWRTDEGAPAVWVTARPDATAHAFASDRQLCEALVGTIVVHVTAEGGVDVFAVPAVSGGIQVLHQP